MIVRHKRDEHSTLPPTPIHKLSSVILQVQQQLEQIL